MAKDDKLIRRGKRCLYVAMYILNILFVTAATCGENQNQPMSFLLVCMFYYRFCALSLHLPRPCVCAQLK